MANFNFEYMGDYLQYKDSHGNTLIINGGIINETATGAVAEFTDGADGIPVKQLMVNIEPIQEGTGNPSPDNVRPIRGRQSVTVTRAGKNLSSVNAVRTLGGDNERTATFVLNYPIPPGTYTVKANVSGTAQCGVQLLKPGATLVNVQNANTATTITLTEPAHSLYFYITQVDYDLGKTATVSDFQIEVGSTSTAYEPYTAQSVTSQLGQTVYGGTVDVVSGEMVVDRAIVDLGTLNWSVNNHQAFGQYFFSDITNLDVKFEGDFTTVIYDAMCSNYATTRRYSGAFVNNTFCFDGSSSIASVSQIQIKDSEYSDAATFKTAMDGVNICYELAQPITVQLTPEQLTTVLGTNNIWSDAGSVSVDYVADTKLYIQNAISEAVSTI